MKAVATAGGGVMFIPEKLERKKNAAVSYRDLLQEEQAVKVPKPFGKRAAKTDQQVAA